MRLGPATAWVRWLLVPGLLSAASSVLASPDGQVDDTDWHVDLTEFVPNLPWVEVSRTCPGQRLSCGEMVYRAAISLRDERHQYRFQATEGQWLTLGTDDADATNPADTVLELLDDDCRTVLASDDDSGPGAYSLIRQFTAPYTGTYIARVRGFDPTTRGSYTLYLACDEAVPPSDDNCGGDLQAIACGSGMLTGETSTYHNDYDPGAIDLSCTGRSADGRDIAIAMDLQEGDRVELEYKTSADGALYILADCAAPSSCEIGIDEVGVGEEEKILGWIAPRSERYYLILDSSGLNTSGFWTLAYTITCRGADAACCLPGGECRLTTSEDCATAGGEYLENEGSCSPNPCATSPVFRSSWGRLKNLYH